MLYLKFKNWPFFAKLIFLSFISLIPLLLLVITIILPAIAKQFYEFKYDTSKQAVEQILVTLDSYNERVKIGEISLEQAQEMAKRLVNNQEIDSNNYFWVNDINYILIVHPLRQNRIGQNVKNLEDADGKKVYVEFVNICSKYGEGFVEYNQLKPGIIKPQPKVSFVKLYKPWNWIVGRGVYLADIKSSFESFQTNILYSSLLALFLALMTGIILARYTTTPIKILNTTAESISEGDLDVSVPYESKDEIGKLASTFNSMITSLKSSIEEIKEKSKEVELAAQETRKANQLKFDFLAMISHEIRTPLSGLINSTDIVVNEYKNLPDDECAEFIRNIKSSSERITRTIDLILNMSAVQSGNYEISKRKINLYKEIIVPLFKEYEQFAQRKNLKFIVEKLSIDDDIYADKLTVEQIISNTIDNAIKFTDQGQIQIITDNKEDKLSVRIIDTGIGISEEFLPQIYTPFSQEEHGYKRKFEGNGLGMALTKKYCEVNDIDLFIQSVKDEGTRVHLVFNTLLK